MTFLGEHVPANRAESPTVGLGVAERLVDPVDGNLACQLHERVAELAGLVAGLADVAEKDRQPVVHDAAVSRSASSGNSDAGGTPSPFASVRTVIGLARLCLRTSDDNVFTDMPA